MRYCNKLTNKRLWIQLEAPFTTMKMAYFLPFACSIAASGYFQWRWRSLNGLRALRLPHQKTVSDLLESTDFPTQKSASRDFAFFDELSSETRREVAPYKAESRALGDACEHLVGFTFMKLRKNQPLWRWFPPFVKSVFALTASLVLFWLVVRSVGGGKFAKFSYWAWQPLAAASVLSWFFYRLVVKQTLLEMPKWLPEDMHLEAQTILEGQSVKPLLAFFAPIRFIFRTLKVAIFGL